MQIEVLLKSMSPEIYLRIRESVETGKWLDGKPLTSEQRETCMQAVMMYQSQVEQSDEHMTVGADGQIVHKSKAQIRKDFSQQNSIARFKSDDI